MQKLINYAMLSYNKIDKILVLFFSVLLLNGCGMIISHVYDHYESCKIKINKKFISGHCEIRNGIQFEKLEIIGETSNSIPKEYYIKERFNVQSMPRQKYFNKIYFSKPNGQCVWRKDSVKIQIKTGKYNERIIIDTLKYKSVYNPSLNSDKYNICPIKFLSNTWYYIYSPGSRNSSRYLYVDKKMKFHLYDFE